jgi:hypothetical protein
MVMIPFTHVKGLRFCILSGAVGNCNNENEILSTTLEPPPLPCSIKRTLTFFNSGDAKGLIAEKPYKRDRREKVLKASGFKCISNKGNSKIKERGCLDEERNSYFRALRFFWPAAVSSGCPGLFSVQRQGGGSITS